jgi:hypothetical protein
VQLGGLHHFDALNPRRDIEELVEAARFVDETAHSIAKGGFKTITLLRGLAFEHWAIELMARYVDLQATAESFVFTAPGSVHIAYDFFDQVLRMQLNPIKITAKVRDVLQMICQRYRPAQANPLISNALKSEEQTEELLTLIAALRDELSNITEISNGVPHPSGLLNLIVASIGDCPDFIDLVHQHFDQILPRFLRNGSTAQQQSVLALIIAAAPLLKTISFEASIEALLEVLPNAPELNNIASRCLVITLPDVRVLGHLIEFLESGRDKALFSFTPLTKYFAVAVPQKMIAIRKIIFAKLSPFLEHPNQAIRKCVISIFADFAMKIPREFESQLKKLNHGQRRLVQLASAKRT